jgi:hypothetical protein
LISALLAPLVIPRTSTFVRQSHIIGSDTSRYRRGQSRRYHSLQKMLAEIFINVRLPYSCGGNETRTTTRKRGLECLTGSIYTKQSRERVRKGSVSVTQRQQIVEDRPGPRRSESAVGETLLPRSSSESSQSFNFPPPFRKPANVSSIIVETSIKLVYMSAMLATSF